MRSCNLYQFPLTDSLRKSIPSDNLAPSFTWRSWSSTAHEAQLIIYTQIHSNHLFPPDQNTGVILVTDLSRHCAQRALWTELHQVDLPLSCSVLWCCSSKACVTLNTRAILPCPRAWNTYPQPKVKKPHINMACCSYYLRCWNWRKKQPKKQS